MNKSLLLFTFRTDFYYVDLVIIGNVFKYITHDYLLPGVVNYKDLVGEQKYSLLSAKLKHFINYEMLRDICKIMIERFGYCNPEVTKVFIVIIESHFSLDNFLEKFPNYTFLCNEDGISLDYLEELKKSCIREYNTFQVYYKTLIYKCSLIYIGAQQFYFYDGEIKFILHCKGDLCACGKTYFEVFYKFVQKIKN